MNLISTQRSCCVRIACRSYCVSLIANLQNETLKMRKTLIVAAGLVSLGALASMQPASAGWIKKKVCNTAFLPTDPPRQYANKCFTGSWVKNGCTTDLVNSGIRRCYDVDVLVPDNWNGASASGVNKTFSPSTNLKNK